MKLRLVCNKSNSLSLSISHIIERPNKDNCEKLFIAKTKKSYFSYYGDKNLNKIFSESNLYVTIEAMNECNFTLTICFGQEQFNEGITIKNSTNIVNSNEDKYEDSLYDLFGKPKVKKKLPGYILSSLTSRKCKYKKAKFVLAK